MSKKNQTNKLKSDQEVRTFLVDSFSVESRDGSEAKRTIVGHAAVFNSEDGPEFFRERIEPGAFRDSINEDDVAALFNHDPSLILGRKSAGTLRLLEDDVGLWMEIDVPDTSYGNDLLTSIARGDIKQASFAFRATDDAWITNDGRDVRLVKKAKLFDVSPVTRPFYQDTDVALRYAEWKQEREQKTRSRLNRCKLQLALNRHT